MNKDTLLSMLDIDEDAIFLLNQKGFNKLEDLATVSDETVLSFICEATEEHGVFYAKHEFRKLRNFLHEVGLTFKDEFKGLGLTLENFNLPLDDLNISTTIRRGLRSSFNVNTLGELLTEVEYSRLDRARNMGVRNIRMLKDYLHGIGCHMKEEELLLDEKLDQLRASGALLLENFFTDGKIYCTLYKHNIFTLDDLLNYGDDVLSIPGFGERRQAVLKDRMKELNLNFGQSQKVNREDVLATIPASFLDNLTQQDVLGLEQENADTLERVTKKELLVAQYKLLYLAKQELIAREAKVDKELDEIVCQIKGFVPTK